MVIYAYRYLFYWDIQVNATKADEHRLLVRHAVQVIKLAT